MNKDEPKLHYTDAELEELFFDKIVVGAENIANSNKKAILRDLRNKLKTLHDGTLVVNFKAGLSLNTDNEMTIKFSCNYDIKGKHSDSLPIIDIKHEHPDLFDEEQETPEETPEEETE